MMPNGLMLYMADTTVANPEFYFALYMKDGYLVLKHAIQHDREQSPSQSNKRNYIKSIDMTMESGLR